MHSHAGRLQGGCACVCVWGGCACVCVCAEGVRVNYTFAIFPLTSSLPLFPPPSLSMAVNVSGGVPRGVLSLASRQYWADSYVAQNHSTESQLHTCEGRREETMCETHNTLKLALIQFHSLHIWLHTTPDTVPFYYKPCSNLS